jgi:sacsin
VKFYVEAFLVKFERKSYTYFIVQGMESTLSKIGIFATAAANEYDIHLLAWASVAACISSIGPEVLLLDSFSVCISNIGLDCQV